MVAAGSTAPAGSRATPMTAMPLWTCTLSRFLTCDESPSGPILRQLIWRLHHLFWGILLLMATGFAALATRAPQWHLRIAIVFGIALGLTLDEFAMWLRLADVYGPPQGVGSLKAGAVVAALPRPLRVRAASVA
jgi:hypothetical protein